MEANHTNIPSFFLKKWQGIADLLAQVMNVPAALIMKLDQEYMEVLISSQTENNPYKPGDREHPDIRLGMIAYLGVPLNYPNKQPFGTICVLDRKEHAFEETFKKLMFQFKQVIELDLALMQTLDWNEDKGAWDAQELLLEKKLRFETVERERTHTELALLHRHQLMNDIIRHDPYGIAVLDNDLHFVYVSERFLSDYRLDHLDVIGKHHYEVFPAIPDAWKDVHQRVLKGEIVTEEDDIFVRDNGVVEHTHWECRPWQLQDGSIGGIIIYTELITKRKALEAATREAYELLKEKSEEVNTFFDCALDLLCISDRQGRLIRLNKEWEAVLGYSIEELEGKKYMDFVHPEDYNESLRIMRALNHNQRNTSYTNRYVCKDGTYRWIEWKATPVGDRIYAAARDITDKIKTNQELLLAKEKAEQSNRLKTEFLNNMSHEIRTPMSGIMGFSEMLNDSDCSSEQRKTYAKIIQSSATQLLKIIDDILEISTLETKQVKLEEESICLNDLLMELYAIFSQRAKRRNLAFRLEKGADDVRSCIVSDKTKINKILSNLLENAIKYTPAGFVEFGYTLEPGWIVLYVKDSGIGIRPESRELIFERFSREEKNLSGSSGGLGLGLSISKENAQLLGGEIGLESTKGAGSTFFVRIPYRSAVPEEVAVIEDKVDAGIDILVAEDEEINYLFLEAVLKRNPYRTFSVLHARNGKEAIDYCLENPSIQLVLMDIKMPVMNGHEATRQIKLLRPDVPIIAQTAYSTEQDRMMALENGCDDFITKPIDRTILFQLLEKHLS